MLTAITYMPDGIMGNMKALHYFLQTIAKMTIN